MCRLTKFKPVKPRQANTGGENVKTALWIRFLLQNKQNLLKIRCMHVKLLTLPHTVEHVFLIPYKDSLKSNHPSSKPNIKAKICWLVIVRHVCRATYCSGLLMTLLKAEAEIPKGSKTSLQNIPLLALVTLKFWPKSAILRWVQNRASYCTGFQGNRTASLGKYWFCSSQDSPGSLSDISTLLPNKKCCTHFLSGECQHAALTLILSNTSVNDMIYLQTAIF